MRTILVHLNVEVEDDDARTDDEIVGTIEGGLEVGLECDSLAITIPLWEAIT